IALQLRLISKQQLDECVRIQSAGTPKIPLGEILLQRGYLSRDQVSHVLDIQQKNLLALDPLQKKKREDVLFGRIVVRQKLATADQVNECLRAQASHRDAKSLGEVMVEQGYISQEQVKHILAHQLKKIMRCSSCDLNFTVVSSTGGKNARCPRCKGALEEVKKEQSVATDGEFETMQVRSVRAKITEVVAPDAKPVRARCVICDCTFESKLDLTGRARCPQCHTSFTPKGK
ncbi:MAG: hypothetical protein ACYTAF_05505, partial [Planctomycetota bacterium]